MVNIILMKNIKKLKINSITYLFILTSFLCGQIKNTLIIFLIVLFHELGHVFFSLLLGFKIKSIEIYPFGGITKIDKPLNTNILKELLIASGGIIFNIILLLINNPLINIYNRNILLFNLIPIIPLDGSKIIFELNCLFFSYKRSLRLTIYISLLCLIIFIIKYYSIILNNFIIISFLVFKLYEYIKNLTINYNKFILERMIYEYNYYKIDNNKIINKYKKGTKYYYFIDNHIADEKEYLINKCKY